MYLDSLRHPRVWCSISPADLYVQDLRQVDSRHNQHCIVFRQVSELQSHRVLRGELSDHVLMEGRGFGFVTFTDPASAQSFLEVTLLQVA